MWNNISIIIIVIIIIIIIIITFIIINKRGSYVKCNEIGVAWHYSTMAPPFWIYANIIFPSFFDQAEKKISNGSTTKFILYVKNRLHAKIGACIRPETINALSDLTKVNESRYCFDGIF